MSPAKRHGHSETDSGLTLRCLNPKPHTKQQAPINATYSEGPRCHSFPFQCACFPKATVGNQDQGLEHSRGVVMRMSPSVLENMAAEHDVSSLEVP